MLSNIFCTPLKNEQEEKDIRSGTRGIYRYTYVYARLHIFHFFFIRHTYIVNYRLLEEERKKRVKNVARSCATENTNARDIFACCIRYAFHFFLLVDLHSFKFIHRSDFFKYKEVCIGKSSLAVFFSSPLHPIRHPDANHSDKSKTLNET